MWDVRQLRRQVYDQIRDENADLLSKKARQFNAEVILWSVRWNRTFPISYRDLELMLLDRGVAVDHSTIFRWIQAYAAELEKRYPATPAQEQRLVAGG